MANIQDKLNNIKNALFGKDVRNSIHDGIDAINKEVESTTNRQEHLETTFDQLTINAGNSNAEIVDARVGENGKSYAKLGDRLDSVDSQLEHNTNEINRKLNISDSGFIRPEWMDSWDVIDQTQAFKDCIKIITDEFKEKGFSSLSIRLRGNYTISSTLKVNSFVKLVTDATTQITFTGEGYLFHIVADDDVLPNLPQVCTSQGNILDGSSGALILKGDLSKKQTAIRLGEDTQGSLFRTSLAQTCISHVYIINFDKSISFSSIQVFINRFFNVSASHCNTIIHDEMNTYNAGELITWTDCSFHNSELFLQSNGETFHEFKGCSVDYNKKGMQFNNDKVVTLRFTDCWIEGNAQSDTDYLIDSTNSTLNASVVFSGCQFHFGNSLPKKLNNGRIKVVMSDNAILIDRHNKNYPNARFLFMFDNDVDVISEKGTLYQYMVSMISPLNCLNRNQYFDQNSIGDSVINRYTVSGATVKTTWDHLFLGTKSVKVDTSSSSYIDIASDLLPLNGYKYVYGNNIFYLGGDDKNLNITLELKFYDSDKESQIGSTVTMYNDMDYSQYPDGHFNAKWGTGITPTKIPNGASFVKIRLIIGNISNKKLYLNGLYLCGYN